METEFDEIEKNELWSSLYKEINTESSKYKYTTKDGVKRSNKTLNRYGDVIPYDHSRVRLLGIPNDYINASLVKVEEAERAYILTQGPLSSTVSHFWLMVWEQRTTAIVMLNRVIERSAIKCHKYWPEASEENLTLNEVSLRVEFVSQNVDTHYTTRNFSLIHTDSEESREITQFQYTSWPDFGVPESPSSFLEFLSTIRESGAFDLTNHGPPVVHCSAGIGRSGTLCLVDTCLVLMEKYKHNKINLRQILLDMRAFRKGLVQTAEQLRFTYIAVLQDSKSITSDATSEGEPAVEAIPKISLKYGDGEEISHSDGDESPSSPLLPGRLRRARWSRWCCCPYFCSP